MRILFPLLVLLLLCWSCQPEHTFQPLEQPAPGPAFERPETPAPHPSILESDWWQGRSTAEQALIAAELAATDNAFTYADLQTRQLTARGRTDKASSTACSGGFPTNPAGDVFLNSQADVNAFGALKCKDITGALVIVDTLGPDPICSLQPLDGLKSVGSGLTINLQCATSLAGLDKLKSIGEIGPFGFIGVTGQNLTDIEALGSLKTLTGSLNIINNPVLTGFTQAFSKVTTLDSLLAPTQVTTFSLLNVNNNTVLSDLSGLSNLNRVLGDLRIFDNGALTDLDGLSSLAFAGEDVFIYDNPSLTQVDALGQLSGLPGGGLFLSGNTSLTGCCGVYGLLCADPPACTTNAVATGVVIQGNGCTEMDILAGGSCAP